RDLPVRGRCRPSGQGATAAHGGAPPTSSRQKPIPLPSLSRQAAADRPPRTWRGRMAVHRVSLFTALLLLLLSFLVAVIIGPIAFLLLVAVAILVWYALGPGSHRSVTIVTD